TVVALRSRLLPSFPTRRSSDLHACRLAHGSVCARSGGTFRNHAAPWRSGRPDRRVRHSIAQGGQNEKWSSTVRSGSLSAERGLRSEENTSELQSIAYIVCRILL